MNNKYPKVNYIGNKEKISEWIISNFPIDTGSVLDVFSGGCSIAYKMKEKGFQVLSNDILYSNFCLSKAIIENNFSTLSLSLNEEELKKFYTDKTFQKIKWMSNRLYFEEELFELACLINFSHTLKGYDIFLFLALLRRSMIRKIPYSRMTIKWEEIVKLRDEELSYQKYKRRRAYHNATFLQHILQNLDDYNQAVFDNKRNNISYNFDCFKMASCIKNIDLVYLDPPYPSTMNNYVGFYGGFDCIFKKGIEKHVDFTNKKSFLFNLFELIKKFENKTKYIVISINNKSNPTPDQIVCVLRSRYSRVERVDNKHVYKVTNKINKNTTTESIIIVEL